MRQSKVLLIGNTYEDTVFSPSSMLQADSTNLGSVSQILGGVWNVARELGKQPVSITVTTPPGLLSPQEHVSTLPCNWALRVKTFVVEDKAEGTRTSYVQTPTEATVGEFQPLESYDVAHFAYLDQLTVSPQAWRQVRRGSRFVSADLCLNSHSRKQVQEVFALFSELDVLFCSEIEWASIRSHLDHQESRRLDDMDLTVISHTPETVTTLRRGSAQVFPVDKLSNVKVLGAGDLFAANYIFLRFIEGVSPEDSAREASNRTRATLGEPENV